MAEIIENLEISDGKYREKSKIRKSEKFKKRRPLFYNSYMFSLNFALNSVMGL